MPKHHKKRRIPLGSQNFLSVLEGVEGGFAIFAGIVVGLSFAPVSREVLIISAAIGIIVSAFNSSAVRFTSEHFLDELDGHEKRRWTKAYLQPALLEFFVYALVSMVAILPLLLIESRPLAVTTMVLLTVSFLLLAGWYRGHVLRGRHSLRDSLEVGLSGSLIIVVGALSGWLLRVGFGA